MTFCFINVKSLEVTLTITLLQLTVRVGSARTLFKPGNASAIPTARVALQFVKNVKSPVYACAESNGALRVVVCQER